MLQAVGVKRLRDEVHHSFEEGFWCPADVEIYDNLSLEGAYIMVFGSNQRLANIDGFQVDEMSPHEKKAHVAAQETYRKHREARE